MNSKTYIYQSSPVDNFTGMLSSTEAISKIIENEFQLSGNVSGGMIETIIKMTMRCSYALGYSKQGVWELDIREMYFFFLPQECNSPRIGIAWKQDNNGTTFIFSPVELPWIEKEYLIDILEEQC